MTTKEHSIRCQFDGSQLQQCAPFDSKELFSYCRSDFSSAQNHRRQRNMTCNTTRCFFWRLAVAISMIAVAAGHSERTPINLDLEEDFFHAVESSDDQSFGVSYHPEKNRSLQFVIPEPIVIPTLPPFSFPPIPPIVILFVPTNRPTPQPTPRPTLRPTAAPISPTFGPTLATTPLPIATRSPTRRPTLSPVVPRTSRPSLAPVAAPTFRPTRSPVAAQTAQTLAPMVPPPSPRPTRGPTPQPTRSPFIFPAFPLPTSEPTEKPQTQRPTRTEPIVSITPEPSLRPNPQPSPRPTRRPSRVPTPVPTLRPTRRPINAPTPVPSPRPTRRPINEPTPQPSLRPTRRPTNEPTPRPTRRPSQEPTPRPTRRPSQEPTPRPTRRPSREPTPRPSPRPTPRPSRVPTNALTLFPTSPLTEQPTRRPTRRPSRQPTNAPTNDPTERPTRRPSPRPTRGPTNRPTRSPTRRPTRSPTRSPTDRPTRNPTDRPTRNPTNRPTRAPTRSPTRAPTNTPTARPTFRPSRPPNFDPTISPSLRPTARPSLRPTPNPTRRPTLSPTPIPTVSPTLFPTPIASAVPSSMPSPSPSLRPSATPSSSPTDRPSALPSSSPSMAPSVSFQPSISSEPSLAPTPDFEFTLITLEAFRVIMEFSVQGRRLQEDLASSNSTEEECMEMWVDYVTKSMKSEVQQVIPRYETLNVQTYNVSRDTFEDLEVLAFFYDVKIDIRSAIIVHNLRRYIGGPFDSSIERDAIVEAMRASSCPEYSNLSAIRVILPDETNISGASRSVDSQNINSGVIAGSVVAVAAAAMLVAILLFVRIKRKRDVLEEIYFDGTQTPGQSGAHDNEMASEIGLQTDVEVSTLGDPIPQSNSPGTGMVGDVSTAGSFSLDYDYKAYYMYQDIPSITEEASRGGGAGDSLTNTLVPADDDTFEAQYGAGEPFEVLAPPGILGLILETNEDGVPTINNIKPASVLADQVQIGDRLLSVDGIDVSIMLASDVSRLIASRKDAPVRKFVFARPRKGAGDFDEESRSIE